MIREPIIYFFDTGLVNSTEGAKFENFVATCLIKHVYGKIDYLGENYSLKYLQTKEKHEVDFAIVKNKKVESIIELKLANHTIGSGLRYFHNKYDLPAIQLVKDLKKENVENGIQIINAHNFLKNLFL